MLDLIATLPAEIRFLLFVGAATTAAVVIYALRRLVYDLRLDY